MGPYYDYSVKFEGTKKAITKALKAVRKIQEELIKDKDDGSAHYCNYRDPIQLSEDEKSILWTYYTTDSDDAWLISNDLQDVALGQGLAFTYYTETTDGTICSSIQTMKPGDAQIDRGCFDAALGIEMAERLLRWRKKPTSIDLAFMATELARAVNIGWSAEDYESLATAGQLRAEIVRTAMEFDLFSEPGCLGLLRSMKGCFDITRETLDSLLSAGGMNPYEGDYAGFDARLEEMELLAAVPDVNAARSTPASRSRL